MKPNKQIVCEFIEDLVGSWKNNSTADWKESINELINEGAIQDKESLTTLLSYLQEYINGIKDDTVESFLHSLYAFYPKESVTYSTTAPLTYAEKEPEIEENPLKEEAAPNNLWKEMEAIGAAAAIRNMENDQKLQEVAAMPAEVPIAAEFPMNDIEAKLSYARVLALKVFIRNHDKLSAVKSCKEWAGCTLKEAKDYIEGLVQRMKYEPNEAANPVEAQPGMPF